MSQPEHKHGERLYRHGCRPGAFVYKAYICDFGCCYIPNCGSCRWRGERVKGAEHDARLSAWLIEVHGHEYMAWFNQASLAEVIDDWDY